MVFSHLPVPAPSGVSYSCTYQDNNSVTGQNTTNYTFSSMDIGSADATRLVVVSCGVVSYAVNTTPTITEVKIGGTAGTLEEVNPQAGGTKIYGSCNCIATRAVSSGATADIKITVNIACRAFYVGLYVAYAVETAMNDSQQCSACGSDNLNVPAGGTAIANYMDVQGTGAMNVTWVGVDEDQEWDGSLATVYWVFSTASKDYAVAQSPLTIQETGVALGEMCCVSLEPS